MTSAEAEKELLEKEEKLLSEWESAARARGGDGFIPDGVVSAKEYLRSNPKIVFVLKEVNSPGASGWRVQDSMVGEENWRVWNNVARWVYGIRNRHSTPSWNEFMNYNDKYDGELAKFRQGALESICSMNLRKVPGGGTADWNVLADAAGKNKNMIQDQYTIYDPDLTICGGTGYFFTQAMGHAEIKWRITKRGVWWYERCDRKYVISYNHPAARTSDSLLFYGLVDAVNEIYDGAG